MQKDDATKYSNTTHRFSCTAYACSRVSVLTVGGLGAVAKMPVEMGWKVERGDGKFVR